MHAWAALPAHPNVVRYFGAWMESGTKGEHVYIQLEKCGASLGQASMLEDFSEPALLEVLRQVWTLLGGYCYLGDCCCLYASAVCTSSRDASNLAVLCCASGRIGSDACSAVGLTAVECHVLALR